MALKNAQGKYLKIESYNLDNGTVNLAFYENKEHRENGDTEFKKHYVTTIEVGDLKSLVHEAIMTLAYLKVKTINGYPEWEDDITTEQASKIEEVKDIFPVEEESIEE